ncbi:hypothetical protein A4R44_02858 [Amycolatopsis sp. M39]|nr:hypothetical protein A4R44_02858 [Amycolatopsis sp. M39]
MRGRVPAAGDDCASRTPRRSRARRGLAHDGRTHAARARLSDRGAAELAGSLRAAAESPLAGTPPQATANRGAAEPAGSLRTTAESPLARTPPRTAADRGMTDSWGQLACGGRVPAGPNTSAGHRESRHDRVMVGALRARHPPPCRRQLAQTPPGRGIADPAAACAQQQHRRRSTAAGSRRGRADRAGARQANPCRLGMPGPAAPVRGHRAIRHHRASGATEPAGTRQRGRGSGRHPAEAQLHLPHRIRAGPSPAARVLACGNEIRSPRRHAHPNSATASGKLSLGHRIVFPATVSGARGGDLPAVA